nr:DUF1236 domain-containing protein [Methylobrevis pamukkalensis]
MTAANAQEGTVNGAAGGAVTGAIVGGPVGAAVGGVVGAAVGTIVAPPEPVQQYVVQQEQPTVMVTEPVAVGQPLPQNVVLYPIPDQPQYVYTVVNNQRVIVDPQTRTVIQVVN